MDFIITVLCAVVVIGFLVFIHEGGHYLASRMFGVRVTEFMLGLPGPHVGFTWRGTKFGVTALPFGGYAKVCGMLPEGPSEHMKPVLVALHKKGSASVEEIAAECNLDHETAEETLDQLVEWGSAHAPHKRHSPDRYRAAATLLTRRQIKAAQAAGAELPATYAVGEARPIPDAEAFYQSEYQQQYIAQPVWKRSVILIAGIAINLLFAMLAFVVIYSVIGMDVETATGETVHYNATPLQSIQIGFGYIGSVFMMILSLFNPQTAADTVSSSTSIVGIAIMSRNFFEQGFVDALFFMAAISVSLGLMNLLPIPPLDGGRLMVEGVQKVTRRRISTKALGYISTAGMVLFLGFFIIMLNQDIQRLLSGFWG